MTHRYTVKDWRAFQHYKNRRPPWIKLHRTLLDDCDFLRLQVASRAIAPLIWLLASESIDGTIDGNHKSLAFRFRLNQKEIDDGIKGLLSIGYISCNHDASGMLAGCKQEARVETETETERERERETETETERVRGFNSFWEAYPKKTGKKAAQKEWDNAKDKPSIAEILSAIELQRGSTQWLKDAGRYIPNPATWINQGRWMDKPTNTTVKSKPVTSRVKTFDEWVTDLCGELNGVSKSQWEGIIARYPYAGYKSATTGRSVKEEALEIMEFRNPK